MGEMGMATPPNSLPMVGGPGQYDYITMGGMFTILKVRDELPADGSEPGWYQPPAGTLAEPAAEDDLKRDGISFAAATAKLEARSGRPVELCDPTLLAANSSNSLKPTGRVKVAMQ
jgi:hypothetical protein